MHTARLNPMSRTMLKANISIVCFIALLVTYCYGKDTVNFFKTGAQSQIEDEDILNVFMNSSSSALQKNRSNNIVSMKIDPVHFDNTTVKYVNSIDDLEEHFRNMQHRDSCLQNITKCYNEGKIFGSLINIC